MRPLISLYFDSVRKANIQSEEDIFFYSSVLQCLLEDTDNRTGLYRIPFSKIKGHVLSADPFHKDAEPVFDLWIQKLFSLNCDSDDGDLRIASKYVSSIYIDRKAEILGIQVDPDLFQADAGLRREDHDEWSDLSFIFEYNEKTSSDGHSNLADDLSMQLFRSLLTFLAEARDVKE